MALVLNSTQGKSKRFTLLSDSIDYNIHRNVLSSYFEIGTSNDFNPLLNILSNDDGYTLGTQIAWRHFEAEKHYFIDLSLSSDLYTLHFWEDRYREDGRIVIPQQFNEINTLKASYSRIISKTGLIISLESGIGVRNKLKPIPGFGLSLQGGLTGRGGYHSLNPKERAQDNIATGDIIPFTFISPSLSKHFLINPTASLNPKDKAYLELKTGIAIGTKQIKSQVFFAYDSELPIWQIIKNNKTQHKISLRVKGDIIVHGQGVQFRPELGFELQAWFLRLGYTSYLNLGNWHSDVVTYYDYESNMRAYIRVFLK